jgi:hypothetical protein
MFGALVAAAATFGGVLGGMYVVTTKGPKSFAGFKKWLKDNTKESDHWPDQDGS